MTLKKSLPVLIILAIILGNTSCTQKQPAKKPTVGIIQNSPASYQGYTLLAPTVDSTVYLLNNCGQVVHTWKSFYRTGLVAYLLPDGTLLRSTQYKNPAFANQGGGRVERLDWEGNVLWEFIYSDSNHHQHHDIAYMPNGNVLMLAFELKSREEAIRCGRDTAKAFNGIWVEHIIEVKPEGKKGGDIVWEWHAWDHAIQEHDRTKQNYGRISDHPELLNVNYQVDASNSSPRDWLHCNALVYNPASDQILLNSRSFSEFLILDHSTTTAEAASHKGGKYGKGGDVLYRWGNPFAYGRGTAADQRLFQQHATHWIQPGLKGEGRLLVFNNGGTRPGLPKHSTVDEIVLPYDSHYIFPQAGKGPFPPDKAAWSYAPAVLPGDTFFSEFISNAQRLPNGNTLICEGMSGHFIEIDSHKNIVWEYINPVGEKGRVNQGQQVEKNQVFRVYRYGYDYPAFRNRRLEAQGYVEGEPYSYDCVLH